MHERYSKKFSQTFNTMHCVCFACSGESAEERLKALLCQIHSELQASSEEELSAGLLSLESVMEKVVVIEGDASRDRFGLSDQMYGKMAAEVDVIIHAAAQVNSVLPYTGMAVFLSLPLSLSHTHTHTHTHT